MTAIFPRLYLLFRFEHVMGYGVFVVRLLCKPTQVTVISFAPKTEFMYEFYHLSVVSLALTHWGMLDAEIDCRCDRYFYFGFDVCSVGDACTEIPFRNRPFFCCLFKAFERQRFFLSLPCLHFMRTQRLRVVCNSLRLEEDSILDTNSGFVVYVNRMCFFSFGYFFLSSNLLQIACALFSLSERVCSLDARVSRAKKKKHTEPRQYMRESLRTWKREQKCTQQPQQQCTVLISIRRALIETVFFLFPPSAAATLDWLVLEWRG